MKARIKPSDLGTMATYAPRTGRPGRPSKRLPQVVVPFLKQLSAGESRRRASRHVGISPKTIQRWLRDDAKFRKSVRKAEREGQGKAAYLRWLNHPFRGLRPPLPKGQRHLTRPRPRFSC
jgi:hypothetical protein